MSRSATPISGGDEYNYMKPADCIHERLRALADDRGRQKAFIFLPNGENEEQVLTFGEAYARALRLSGGLATHCERPVMLLLPPGNDYIVALFACFIAGVVAVPA